MNFISATAYLWYETYRQEEPRGWLPLFIAHFEKKDIMTAATGRTVNPRLCSGVEMTWTVPGTIDTSGSRLTKYSTQPSLSRLSVPVPERRSYMPRCMSIDPGLTPVQSAQTGANGSNQDQSCRAGGPRALQC